MQQASEDVDAPIERIWERIESRSTAGVGSDTTTGKLPQVVAREIGAWLGWLPGETQRS